MDIKIYVVSYKKDNNIWNEPYNKCIEQYKNLGYIVDTIEGYNFKNYKNIKKTQLCYKNFLDKFLIECIKHIDDYKGFIYSEDDAYLKEKITIDDEDKINWLGYAKIDCNDKMYGASIIYIPSNKVKLLYYKMKYHKPCHLDYFLDLYVKDKIIKKNTICLEIPHISFMTNKMRRHKNVLK